MLVFNPHRRISVEDALADPYMESLHAEEDEPKAESQFDYKFEEQLEEPDVDKNRRMLRELIAKESLHWHPDHADRLGISI